MSRSIKKKKTGGKSVDRSCGNNKGCPACEGNRLHKHKKKELTPRGKRLMSLIFTPKIPKEFSNQVKVKPKVKRPPPIVWSDSDLTRLINLRAMGVSFKECGPLTDRTMSACVAAVDSNNLYGSISARRHVLIKEILR